jgi:lysophospholipase L1-like esterase
VLILGDSHARGCAQEIQHYLNLNFSIQGIVKPGAIMKDIVSSPSNLVKNLDSKDTVVIWGGTHDIGKNESNQALKEIKIFVQTHSKNHVTVMGAPHQYDLSQTSCVNQEMNVFNRKLCKYLRAYNNTQIVEVDLNRVYYTRHDLHLNCKGKELIAKKIAWAIQDKLTAHKYAPIIMSHNPSTNAIIIPDQPNTTIHITKASH